MRRLSVLVVEDDVDMAENLAEILELDGIEVTVLYTAMEALERLAERTYDGVITDFRLPGISGVDLIVEMRKRGVTAPVIVTSAFMDRLATQAARSAGALDVLEKPLDFRRLAALVAELERSADDVVIVEDNRELAEDIAQAFREQGLSVRHYETAEAALGDRKLPRVALVDVNLPDQSGIDVARQLAARDPNIRIVFVTGFGEQHRAELVTVPGVDPREPYVSKPFDLAKLVQMVVARARAVRVE